MQSMVHEMWKCPKCRANLLEISRHCPVCGDERPNLRQLSHRRKVRQACGVMIIAAVFTLITTSLDYSNPEYQRLAPSEERTTRLLASLVSAGILICLGIWCRKQPFAACTTGICLFAVGMIVHLIRDPSSLHIPGVIDVIVLAAQAIVIHSSLRMRKSIP